jgi:hypothetical protein
MGTRAWAIVPLLLVCALIAGCAGQNGNVKTAKAPKKGVLVQGASGDGRDLRLAPGRRPGATPAESIEEVPEDAD